MSDACQHCSHPLARHKYAEGAISVLACTVCDCRSGMDIRYREQGGPLCVVCSCVDGPNHPTTHDFVAPRNALLKGSGERVTHTTGAVRDSDKGRGRYDLVSPIMMERLAKHLEKGAETYEERNWEKGLSIARCFRSMFRHSWQAFCQQTDEDHLAAIICNAMFIMHTLEMITRGRLPASLNDLPSYMPIAPQEQSAKLRDLCEYCPHFRHLHVNGACGGKVDNTPCECTLFCEKLRL